MVWVPDGRSMMASLTDRTVIWHHYDAIVPALGRGSFHGLPIAPSPKALCQAEIIRVWD
jgi:malate/lactate dehydrogenase